MNMNAAGNKKVQTPVTKPWLKGELTDKKTPAESLKVFGMLVAMCLLMLFAGVIMMVNNTVLRVIINTAIAAICCMIFYSVGAAAGTSATGFGEIALKRQESGKPLSKEETAVCFHPWKGLVIALLGTLPFLILSIYLAAVTKRQITGAGALPSWVAAYSGREEVWAPLTAYQGTQGMTFETIARMIVRMVLMPWFSMAGNEEKDILVLIERLSPLLMLLPGVSYAIGYSRGPVYRSKVHTDIAANRRKRARKERKERKARMARKPEQLN